MKIGSSVEKYGSPLKKSNRGRSIFFAHHGPEILTHFDMVIFCLTIEEDGNKLGNKLSANFVPQAKNSLSKAMSEKTCHK